MKRIILIIAMCLLAGCAKRYDTLTKIESTTETTIKHDGTAPVSQEIPMAAGTFKHNVGTGPVGPTAPAGSTIRPEPWPWPTTESAVHNVAASETRKSLRGKNLVEVTFIKQHGQYSVLEVVETGERFQLKGSWGAAGDRFKIER